MRIGLPPSVDIGRDLVNQYEQAMIRVEGPLGDSQQRDEQVGIRKHD